MRRMCKARRGVVVVPNVRHNTGRALQAAAENDALAQVTDDEKLIRESVRVESMTPQSDDLSRLNVYYVCTVMVPGCSGWSRPLT